MLSDKTWRLQVASEYEGFKIGILAWTKCPIFRRHIRRSLSGTEAKNVSQKAFLAAPFPSCSPETFSAFSSELETICEVETTMNRRLEQAKDVLAQFNNRFLGR